MFPFKKSAGYPNIGREVTEESAGFAFSNAAISSGGDFFQTIARKSTPVVESVARGCVVVAANNLPKVAVRVRFPSPAL